MPLMPLMPNEHQSLAVAQTRTEDFFVVRGFDNSSAAFGRLWLIVYSFTYLDLSLGAGMQVLRLSPIHHRRWLNGFLGGVEDAKAHPRP